MFNNITNKIKFFLILFLSFSLSNIKSANYQRAFDQEKIYKKYATLMHHLNCAENVFSSSSNKKIKFDDTDYKSIEECFKKECLAKLNSEKRWDKTAPIRTAISFLILQFVIAKITPMLANKDSFGGSFSLFSAITHIMYESKRIIDTLFLLAYEQEHPLDNLEKQYVVVKCFIPKKLWHIIKDKFMLAQRNQFEQRRCIDFIEFSLGLTTYQPRSIVEFNFNVIEDIFKNLDNFFNDYEAAPEELSQIKVSILKFIQNISNMPSDKKSNKSRNNSRYQYFFGPGGIGKTHLVNQICNWINKLMPNAVHFEEITIQSPSELFGDCEAPGMFLKVLRNQLQSNKLGTIIFMDEANWLNNPSITNQAKATLNGDLSSISTKYFGAGIDGSGIKIDMPPILIFAASNDEIKDKALKSRFDNLKFPNPKKETLIEHAKNIFLKSYLYEIAKLKSDESNNKIDLIQNKISEKILTDENIVSFRDIDAITEPLAFEILYN